MDTISQKGIVLKKLLLSTLILTSLSASELIQIHTSMNVNQCTNAIVKAIDTKKDFGVFTVIDHQKNAQKVGMDLPAQKIIIFGNPKAGTLLIQADAQIGYDLPLRIMVRSENGKTVVEYRDPKQYKTMYQLNKSPLPNKMSKLLNGLAYSCQ